MLNELSEDINSIKKIQPEIMDTLVDIKNNLQGNNSGVGEAENQISHLEQKEEKTINQNNRKKKESKKTEDSISSFWYNFKRSNICIMGCQKEK